MGRGENAGVQHFLLFPHNLFMRMTHSEHLGQSLDRASDVCRRSNMLRKLTCIAGSSYSSNTVDDIIP